MQRTSSGRLAPRASLVAVGTALLVGFGAVVAIADDSPAPTATTSHDATGEPGSTGAGASDEAGRHREKAARDRAKAARDQSKAARQKNKARDKNRADGERASGTEQKADRTAVVSCAAATSHGEYVSSVARSTTAHGRERGKAVSAAARSSCGKAHPKSGSRPRGQGAK